jgi:hypothetical protein
LFLLVGLSALRRVRQSLAALTVSPQGTLGDYDIRSSRLRLQTRDRLTSNPVGLSPLLVFDEPTVAWDDLAPFGREAFPTLSRREIVGTFPVPGSIGGSGLEAISATTTAITFPGPGAYYLYTTIGTFKILVVARGERHLDRILSVARFLAANSVHSRADSQLIQPIYGGQEISPKGLLYTLFATGQPLKLHCGDVADFLCWLLAQLGYCTRIVLLRSERTHGHVVSEVIDPDTGREFMIDCNKGFAVADRMTGEFLPIASIARRFRENPSDLVFVDLGACCFLMPRYNNPVYQGPFTWTPDKSRPKDPSSDWYRKVLELRSYSLEALPWGLGRRGRGVVSKWDGSLL